MFRASLEKASGLQEPLHGVAPISPPGAGPHPGSVRAAPLPLRTR